MEKLSYRFIQTEVTKMRKEVEELASKNESDELVQLWAIDFYDIAKQARFAWRKGEQEYEKGNKYQIVFDFYESLIKILDSMKKSDAINQLGSEVGELKKIRESLDGMISDFKEEDKEKENVALIKNGRGGKREGAGRTQIGERRVVSISLPDWSLIDKAVESGEVKSTSEFFRRLVMDE